MKTYRVRPNPSLLAAALAGIAWHAAGAQTLTPGAAGDGIQEVIVTAQRSAAPESRTPVAMSVLTGEQLGKLGLDDPMAIGDRLPNTYFQYGNDGLRITIRGDILQGHLRTAAGARGVRRGALADRQRGRRHAG